jgi:hypothetical protein
MNERVPPNLQARSVPLVTPRQKIITEAIQWLSKHGFVAASGTGVVDAYSRTRTRAIGVLRDEPIPPYTTWWRFLLIPQHRREFIGVLWFDNSHRGTDCRTWIFDVYGKNNLDAVQRLSSEMSRMFNIIVRPHLMDEISRFEDFV